MRNIQGVLLSFILVILLSSCSRETEAVAGVETEKIVKEVAETNEIEERVEEQPTEEEVEITEETIIVYAGSINQKYPIHMTIVQNGSEVIGSYYYDSRKIDIPFTGKNNDGDLFITTDDGSETFDGKYNGNQINGTWTMGETVYDFDLIEESKVDTSTYAQASINEEIILEFNLAETGEGVGIYVDSDNDYIVFRLASDGNILVEGPSFDQQSWDYFSYERYHRGGGVGNEGIDTATLTFTIGLVEYSIAQEYSAVENKTIHLFYKKDDINTEAVKYVVDESSVVGDLYLLDNFDKLKH